MKTLLNRSVLAVLYYNEKEPNRYRIDEVKDRQKAERAFAQTKPDPEMLAKAVQTYLDLLQSEIEALLR
jgi:hypothetical protein